MRHPLTTTVLVVLASSSALFLGWANFHTDESGFLAGCVALFAFLWSAIRPRWAPFFALWCGASVPAGAIVCRALGVVVRFPNEWTNIAQSCLAFVPAAIGALMAVAIRRGLERRPSGQAP